MSETATLQREQPRCMDFDCPKSSKCARFLQRKDDKARTVNATMESKHPNTPCMWFTPQPRVIEDKPTLKFN